MLKSSRFEKDKKIEDNLREKDDTTIKNIRNIFRLKKENITIKNGRIRDIRSLFENEEDYYKPVKAVHFWSNNYTEYEGNVRNKTLPVEEYLIKIISYLKDIMNNLGKYDT